MHEAISIYWAGGLFDHKELLGNLLLSSSVAEISCGRYKPILPQNGEYETSRDIISIRNADLLALLNCDVILANFDGTELDSGTVVEFCFAKALDIPAVLLRTDFRNCGDSTEAPWNLMCSGWQRTETLWINSMDKYHEHKNHSHSHGELLNNCHREMAGQIINSLDAARTQAPWLDYAHAFEHYRRIIKSAGNGLEEMLPDETLKEILAGKHERGML